MNKLIALPLLALPLLAIAAATPAMLTTASYAANVPTSKLGDLTLFEGIASDTLMMVDKGDLAGAKKRITDFETAWDKDQSRLYHLDKAEWGVIDDAADKAISSLRAAKPTVKDANASVTALIAAIQHPSTP